MLKELSQIQEQINDTKKLVLSVREQLVTHANDATLDFLLKQDMALLENLQKEYRATIVASFQKAFPFSISTPSEIIEKVYSKDHHGKVDPFYIAAYFGIPIIKNPFMTDGIGKSFFDGAELSIEYKPTSWHRDKFTIAHELGHIFTHFATGVNYIFVDHETEPLESANNTDYQPLMQAARNSMYTTHMQQIESEADDFAGELLVPKHSIEKLIKMAGKGRAIKASLLQKFYEVSPQVLSISLNKYGLLNSGAIVDDL